MISALAKFEVEDVSDQHHELAFENLKKAGVHNGVHVQADDLQELIYTAK